MYHRKQRNKNLLVTALKQPATSTIWFTCLIIMFTHLPYKARSQTPMATCMTINTFVSSNMPLQNILKTTDYFPMYWCQGNSMCIDRRQVIQLCPVHVGCKAGTTIEILTRPSVRRAFHSNTRFNGWIFTIAHILPLFNKSPCQQNIYIIMLVFDCPYF